MAAEARPDFVDTVPSGFADIDGPQTVPGEMLGGTEPAATSVVGPQPVAAVGAVDMVPAKNDDDAERVDNGTPIVRIEKLWTIFGTGLGAAVVHKDLDLTIGAGEIVSLVGGSGSGKTTLFRQILGLAQPSRGTVRVLGRPPSELGGRGAATRIGMLFQHGALFSAFSVLDNVAFALRELQTVPDDLVYDAAMVKLRMVGLKATDATKMPSDLSGGMVKRVALARALVMDPPLLLLDEPTAGLDPAASDSFCDLLTSLHAELGLTVIMVTHDLDTVVELSTQVAVLADKRVVICAPLDQVAAYPHPFIEEYFHGKRGERALTALDESTEPGSALDKPTLAQSNK